jgi:hypothetical protein
MLIFLVMQSPVKKNENKMKFKEESSKKPSMHQDYKNREKYLFALLQTVRLRQ